MWQLLCDVKRIGSSLNSLMNKNDIVEKYFVIMSQNCSDSTYSKSLVKGEFESHVTENYLPETTG